MQEVARRGVVSSNHSPGTKIPANLLCFDTRKWQVEVWIKGEDSGQVTKTDRWGRRKLAYEIDKQRDGYYIFINADMEADNLGELERNLKLSPRVLRHLIIRADE